MSSPQAPSLSEVQQAWAKLIAKAWMDESFKRLLIANPKKILKENGIQIDDRTEYHIHESTEGVVHLVIPPRPKDAKKLEHPSYIAGGTL